MKPLLHALLLALACLALIACARKQTTLPAPVPEAMPAANLVLLVDTSGSMDGADRIELVKAALRQLVRKLRAKDRVAIVTYVGDVKVALEATPGDQQAKILATVDRLAAAGLTYGSGGIETAYRYAHQGFIQGGINRVLLATDGDFNVGTTSIDALQDLVARERRSGIAFSILGVGRGNFNDALTVRLADAGDGSFHYLDNLQEAQRVLNTEIAGALWTIARDVKLQVEFNPAQVAEYRLIGYAKRVLNREDFNNDAVDAGDVGAGANVTALYEIVPTGSKATFSDALRYAAPTHDATPHGDELAFLRVRYKEPGEGRSRLIEQPIAAQTTTASERLRFAAAVAAFAETLRGSPHVGDYGYARIAELANSARGQDPDGWRGEFVRLVKLAASLQPQAATDE